MTELIQYNIDDRDPRVSYSGNWTAGGTPSDFNGTLSSSTRVGDFFVVPFWGQSIIIYGHIDTVSGGVITNYSIDGLPPEQAVSPPGTGDIPQQQFWASPTLDNTQHNLTVTMAYINRGDPDPSEGTIWFDFFAVNNQTSTPGGSGNGDGSSGSGSGSGGSGSGGSGSGGGEHTRSLPQNLSRGAIGGIVVGAVLFFCLIGVAVIWSIKERREPRTVYRPTGYWYWPKAPSNTIDHDNPKSSSKHLPSTINQIPISKRLRQFAYTRPPLPTFSAFRRSRDWQTGFRALHTGHNRQSRRATHDAGAVSLDLSSLDVQRVPSHTISATLSNSSTDTLSSTTTVVEV